ncbi:DMT family transporter [Pseudoxanthomonas winnipegensis]|jgi:S-adenosylmethionine uptake transporter|uniref:DMT family transporter n=1 Tax=Pseudoxanthomonas winnipegensis TaxID=2480810 RepID=A0A4Q8L696_9GAMM|nr:DMT family transporter [Pseudoxanthomonas winnipegensis]PZP61046.1 MAG: EamA family transporter [Pseudoxanthomonas spadix]TAA23257.1 DMT family transporter [Pseudoxanthomonas winnipegensis]HCH0556761.1 DMT family transporter [Pseudomonas aeruginosa]
MFKGVLLGFACYAAYAISDAFVKLLDGSLPSYEVVFFGALLMLVAVPFLKKPQDRWREVVVARKPAIWLLRAFCGAAGNLTSVIAFTHLPMAEAFALIFLMPIFVTVLSVLLLREEVHWRRWTAVAVGFIGVLVVLRPGFRQLSQGHVAAILCGLTGAVSVISLRMAGPEEKRVTLYGAGVLGPLVAGGILMLPHFVWPSAAQWGLIAGYGLLAGLAAILMMYSTRLAPVSAVAPTQYSQMLWAIGFGAWLFHSRVDAVTWIGIALILASGLVTFIRWNQIASWRRRMRIV